MSKYNFHQYSPTKVADNYKHESARFRHDSCRLLRSV